MRISIFRRAHFNAAHRLHNPNWSDEKNAEVYGLCNNEHYHGHNYDLIVRVTGEVDQDSGYLMDLKVLSDIIKKHVENVFDHMDWLGGCLPHDGLIVFSLICLVVNRSENSIEC